MVSDRFKEMFLVEPRTAIPYSRILETLKSGWQVCLHGRKVEPNRFVLFLSPADRKTREKSEAIFLDELSRDLICFQDRIKTEHPLSRIEVEVRTEETFQAGRIRVEYYRDDTLIYGFEQEDDVAYCAVSSPQDEEWQAVDILPQLNDTSKKYVLVVDDEVVLCAVLGRMLSRLGYNAVCAHDGVEAVEIMASMGFDLVITDLRMPRMDGWALMQYVKKRTPDVPVVLITGYHSMHTQTRATQSMADGYLSKPFSFEQIKELLTKVLCTGERVNTAITHCRINREG